MSEVAAILVAAYLLTRKPKAPTAPTTTAEAAPTAPAITIAPSPTIEIGPGAIPTAPEALTAATAAPRKLAEILKKTAPTGVLLWLYNPTKDEYRTVKSGDTERISLLQKSGFTELSTEAAYRESVGKKEQARQEAIKEIVRFSLTTGKIPKRRTITVRRTLPSPPPGTRPPGPGEGYAFPEESTEELAEEETKKEKKSYQEYIRGIIRTPEFIETPAITLKRIDLSTLATQELTGPVQGYSFREMFGPAVGRPQIPYAPSVLPVAGIEPERPPTAPPKPEAAVFKLELPPTPTPTEAAPSIKGWVPPTGPVIYRPFYTPMPAPTPAPTPTPTPTPTYERAEREIGKPPIETRPTPPSPPPEKMKYGPPKAAVGQ